LLGTFFWSYSLCVVPVGYLVDRFGVRWIFPLSFTAWSLITSVTGLATSFPALLAARIALGLAESPISPATVKVVSQWFPHRERAFATSIWGVGSRLGAMVALPVSALLAVHLGWRWTFIIVGTIGLLWLPFWLTLYRLPREHRSITAEELRYIETDHGANEHIDGATARLPWATLLRYRTVWGLMLGSYCASYSNAFFLTWLPSYLVLTRHFSLPKAGFVGMLPSVAAVIGTIVGGLISDGMFRRGWDLTVARKTVIVAGVLGGAVIGLVPFIPNVAGVMALLSLSYGSVCLSHGPQGSLPTEIAPTPRNVSSISSLMTGSGQLAVVMMPIFTGAVVDLTGGSFDVPLFVAGVVVIIGAASYLFIVGRVEPLPMTVITARVQIA